MKSKPSTVVKKLAYVCSPSQTVFRRCYAVLTDVDANQSQAINPDLGKLDNCMPPDGLRL